MCLIYIIPLLHFVVIQCKELSFIDDGYNLTNNLKVSQVISSICSSKRLFPDGCYNKDILEDIPYIENREQYFKEGAIFFIDTSCDGVLDWSKACSVEAAAISNPQRQIVVLFSGPVSTKCINLAPTWEILKYTNIYIYRVNIDRYIKDTPLVTLKSTLRFPKSRLGEIIKFITLYKFGGIYVHFDMMLVKSFDLLPEPKNWVGKADQNTLGECLALSKHGVGNLISQTMLRYYRHFFNTTKWEMSDTETLTKVLQNICHTANVTEMSATLCGGFEVYDSFYFDPVKSDDYDAWREFFALSYNKYPAEPFAFRVRTNIMRGNDVTPAQNLRMNYCPRIMQLSGFEVYDSFYFDPVKSDDYDAWREFFALSYNKYPAEPFAFRVRTNIMRGNDVTPAQNLRMNYCPRIMQLSGFEVYDSFYFDPVKSDDYDAWREFFALSYNKYPAEPFAFRVRTNIMRGNDVTPAQNLRMNYCPRIMQLSGKTDTS